MKKMKKNARNSYLRSFFGLEARPEGKFRGQVPYKEALEPLGYKGGQKLPKKLKNCYEIEKYEQICLGQRVNLGVWHHIQMFSNP